MNAPAPGSPEWRKLVTASKVAAILGLSPWESPFSLWCDMKGLTPPVMTTDAMRRGNYLEPAILAWFRDRHGLMAGEFFREQVWVEFEDWAGATVDAEFTADAPVIVEAKSTASFEQWGDEGTDQIPTHYLTQVLFQLEITGAARCYVPVFGGHRLEFREYVVQRDEQTQAEIMSACRRFYESLASDEAPDLDASTATYEAVRKLHPEIDPDTVEIPADFAAEYIDAGHHAKAAIARERAAKAQLLNLMGRARYADANGIRVARRQPNKYGVSLVPVAKTTEQLKEIA